MYKQIFKWVIMIISQPSKAWTLLARKEEKQEDFLSQFVYPLMGLMTVAAFLGVLFTQKDFDLELALKSAIRTLVSSFGGFYLGAYLLNEIWQGICQQPKQLDRWLRFVGYASAMMFTLQIVLELLPEFFFLRIFVFYTIYIVWEGAIPFWGVKEAGQMKFTGVVALVVMGMPFFIEKLITILMPGLRF